MKKIFAFILPIMLVLSACNGQRHVYDAEKVQVYQTHLTEGIAHVCPATTGAQAPALTNIQQNIAGLNAQWDVIQKAEAQNGLNLPGLTVSGMTDAPTVFTAKCSMLQGMTTEAGLLASNPETESAKSEKIAIWNLAEAALNSDGEMNVIFNALFASAQSALNAYKAAVTASAENHAKYASDPSSALQSKLGAIDTSIAQVKTLLERGDWTNAQLAADQAVKDMKTLESLKTLPTTTPTSTSLPGAPTAPVSTPMGSGGSAVIVPSDQSGSSAQPTVTPIVILPNP